MTNVFSFDLSSEDKYGATTDSLKWQWGTLTDDFVFKNRVFNINLTNIDTDYYEDMICVEWNDYINEGGTRFTFEPNKCFFRNGLSSSNKTGCQQYVSSHYGSPINGYDSNAYTNDLNFPMDTSVALDIDTWFIAFKCDSNMSLVLEGINLDKYFSVGDERKWDCHSTRGNDFYLQYHNKRYDGVVGWYDLYSHTCIDMISDRTWDTQGKFFQYNDPTFFNLVSGKVQCDVVELPSAKTTYASLLSAQHSQNDHPCTINEGVNINNTGAVTCNDIDEDECQTGICNGDVICGSCAITSLYYSSDGTINDTDSNYLLPIGGIYQIHPHYSQSNYQSGQGIDCVAYDIDGDGLYERCRGKDTTECNNLITKPFDEGGDEYCFNGNITDRNDVVDVTQNNKTKINIFMKALDVSCNQQATFSHYVNWTSVLANYEMLYSEQNHRRQFRTDTQEFNLTIIHPTEDLSKYFCSIECDGGSKTSTEIGYFSANGDYVCNIKNLNTWLPSCSLGSNISANYKIYLDADVTYEYPQPDNSLQGIWSNNYYGDWGEGQIGILPRLNNGWTNNPTFPTVCYFGVNCTSSDDYLQSPVGSWYDNSQTNRHNESIYRVTITYVNLNTNLNYTYTKTGAQIYSSTNRWLWNDSYAFPSNVGRYNGRIVICYSFGRFTSYYYCKSQDYAIQALPNTLNGYLQVYYNGVSQDTGFSIQKSNTLKFCMNNSIVGSNNTGVRAVIDYNNDGIIDYNGTLTNCLNHIFSSTESGSYLAKGTLYSNEGRISQTSFDYTITGICGDSITDWDENGIDNINAPSGWSTKCWGTCNDHIRNANEIDTDYGGRCGQCSNTSDYFDDLEFQLLQESNIITYPFDVSECQNVTAIASVMPFLIILTVVLLSIILVLFFIFFFIPLIAFIFTGRFRIFLLSWLFKKKGKKPEKQKNNNI